MSEIDIHMRGDLGSRWWQIGWYVAGIVLASIGYSILIHPYFYGMQRYGMLLRVACCKLVYRKALRLSKAALGKTTVGQMVNLISNDVQRFDTSLIFPSSVITSPLNSAIVIGVLWPRMGVACLAGMAILILYLPLQSFFGRLLAKIRSKTALLTDERVRLMNEIMPAMKVIKMYSWEKPFAKLVEAARRREVSAVELRSFIWSINMALYYSSSKVILLITFLVFLILGHQLNAENVFVTMALLNIVRQSMTFFFPYSIMGIGETLTSIKRLEKFLLLEEKNESGNYIKISDVTPADKTGGWLEEVTAKWNVNDPTCEQDTLSSINLAVQPGELAVCVGPVGSGKSSVLMALLGEIPIISGRVRVNGRIAYAGQEAWTFAGSVRENILFGQPFDPTKYRKVIHVCALERDLTLLPYGDKTLVGERGVSLSGGQKARVNLARALYQNAEIYLLDDPLSAVDSHVASHIFEKAIRYYLQNKTVVLVTHQLQFIKQATNILYLDAGHSLAQGTFDELIKQGIDFVKLEVEEQRRRESVSSAESSSSNSVVAESSQPKPIKRQFSTSIGKGNHLSDAVEAKISDQQEAPKVHEEKAAVGSVKARVWGLYIRLGAGPLLLPLVILSNVVCQFLFNGSDYWLKLWTDSEQRKFEKAHNITSSLSMKETLVDRFDRRKDAIIYGVLVAALFVFSLVRACCFFMMCMRSSIKVSCG